MKKVTTQIVYGPRSVTPEKPDLKAVIIDNERFILDEHKAYTYAPADFATDEDTVVLYDGIKADISDLSVLDIEGKVKSGDTAVDLLTNEAIENLGFFSDEGTLSMYEWALGLPIMEGPITVEDVPGEDYGSVLVPGSDPEKSYYMVAKVAGSWVAAELLAVIPTTTEAATTEAATTEAATTEAVTTSVGATWYVESALIPDNTYILGDAMIYEDAFGIFGENPSPVSVYLSINQESTDDTYRRRLTEIENYGQLADMYGTAALDTPGNIAYSAGLFFLQSGGVKTFYIAPMTSEDDIADLIEELKTHADTYYLIYNMGGYTENKADADALFTHVKMMSAPLYKRERRLYLKEDMVGVTASAVLLEQAAIINAALGLDNERVSLVIDYADTYSFIKYCARRYAVNRDYSLTYEPIEIGSIWDQVSNLSEAQKEELKDNGVVSFDQDTPTSVPYVMFQTTTYIESDILAKKEENIQIAIDELCLTMRQVLEPRIAKGMDNKVSTDPTSAISIAYIKNLNADASVIRREFSGTFSSINVVGVELDENDPRHVRMRVAVVPNYNVNRIDVTIYVV